MHLIGSPQSPRFRLRPPGSGPHSPGLAFVAVLVVALAVFVLVLPHSVVLPVFSLWALSAAVCAALLAVFPLRSKPSYAGAAWDMTDRARMNATLFTPLPRARTPRPDGWPRHWLCSYHP